MRLLFSAFPWPAGKAAVVIPEVHAKDRGADLRESGLLVSLDVWQSWKTIVKQGGFGRRTTIPQAVWGISPSFWK